MATQQQPAFDTNQPLPPDGTLRSAAWKKDYCGSASQRTGSVHYGQVWLGAILEAQSWKLRDETKRIPAFEAMWERTKESIEAKMQVLRNLTAAGNKLAGDAEILLASSNVLRQALLQTKQTVLKAGDLPQVHADERTILPRAYAAVASYLQAVGYEFDEQTFEQYFTAIQETVAFQMRELWQLQPFAKLVLLESVAALADRLDTAAPLPPSDATVAVPETVAKEHFGAPSLAALIASMRRVDGADWNEVFERVNAVEQILRRDPCDAYGQMDFESRDNYRKTIAQLAKRSEATEQDVARKTVELARPIHASPHVRIRDRQSHVGYYLVNDGRKQLEHAITYRPTFAERVQRLVKRWPDFSYILGIELVTLALMAAVVLGGKSKPGWLIVALFLLPAAECAVALVNPL
jgi:cyclic beta-1,2-glucan synthetase